MLVINCLVTMYSNQEVILRGCVRGYVYGVCVCVFKHLLFKLVGFKVHLVTIKTIFQCFSGVILFYFCFAT